MAARKGSLVEQGMALEAALAGVCGEWGVSAFGFPECMPAIVIRPIQGETPIPGEHCQCQTVWLISAYTEICEGGDSLGTTEAIYQVMSGCEPCSIPRLLIEAQRTHFKGVGRITVRPPSGFGFTAYNSDEANNAYAATVEVVFQYCCCDENVRNLQ